jgi:iron complex transport system substrate-binding protein
LAENFPARIVCLSAESAEIISLLGRDDLIVGISVYCAGISDSLKSKPKVSSFTKANLRKIAGLEPDICIAYSDVQADICKELIKSGINVICFNQRTIYDILNIIEVTGRLINEPDKAIMITNDIKRHISSISNKAGHFIKRPKVYFEEWNSPLVTGIKWVSEIIEIAGGICVFKKRSDGKSANERIVNSEEVIAENPDIVIASWCGKKVDIEEIRNRHGWDSVNAVIHNRIYEISSDVILQPGPRLFYDGLVRIYSIIKNYNDEIQTNIY